MIVEGQCHCGNMSFSLQTHRLPDELGPRCCSCSFCTVHGAVYMADAAGKAVIRLSDPDATIRYRFAAQTTDFLICGICGILVATLVDGTRSAVNLNLTEYRGLESVEDRTWRSQSGDERRAYRAARWTPTEILPAPEKR